MVQGYAGQDGPIFADAPEGPKSGPGDAGCVLDQEYEAIGLQDAIYLAQRGLQDFALDTAEHQTDPDQIHGGRRDRDLARPDETIFDALMSRCQIERALHRIDGDHAAVDELRQIAAESTGSAPEIERDPLGPRQHLPKARIELALLHRSDGIQVGVGVPCIEHRPGIQVLSAHPPGGNLDRLAGQQNLESSHDPTYERQHSYHSRPLDGSSCGVWARMRPTNDPEMAWMVVMAGL
ncbi:MAG TPA: hypothetical protein VFG23_06635 [Polyangia bacterium]|nr:hypothetical protein [Polyangia bacterium]